jgi:cyclopropane fatty-acyl-phospholipid synthase-like methyltransferase
MSSTELPFAPACERNKQPIFEVLDRVLPAGGTILEIGSGTGQHVTWFAAGNTARAWQPSDRDEYLPGLQRRIEAEAGENVRAPIRLDVLEFWPERKFDAVYSANTAHIMPWEAVCAMFAGVATHLQAGGLFCLYGPFNEGGKFTAPSNAAFDAQLRQQDPAMGIRDMQALETLANSQQLSLQARFQLPANNQILVFASNGTCV